MKKKIILFLFFVSFNLYVFSQSGVHDGGKYIKRIENNLYLYGMPELRSKGVVEKLFFGDFNASVEFFHNFPSYNGQSGFRLVRDSLGVYLELKYITNYKLATKEVNDYYASNPQIAGDRKNYWNDVCKFFNVETRRFTVSEQFAEKLFEKMVYFIDNFKAKTTPSLILDGYSVVFRTVVAEDEQWSLWIHTPGGGALRMSNLCVQIIEDMQSNKFDESKYLTVLDTFKD